MAENQRAQTQSAQLTQQAAQNPQAPAQTVQPKAAQPVQAAAQAAAPQTPAAPQSTQTPAQPAQTPPPKKANTKKVLIGCGAGFVFLIIVALVLTFIFLGAPTAQRSPLAEALGVDPLTLIDSLTMFVRIFFLILAFILFIAAMVGIFKTALAKKDDPSRKQSVLIAGVSGALLIVILFLWGGSELYLYQKRQGIQALKLLQRPAVTTDPGITKELSAPIIIKFDASGAEAMLSKYNIINYEWDFGDNEKGNGKTTSHEYKDKGKKLGVFQTVLTVKYKDAKAKEFTQVYNPIDITITNLRPQGEIKAEPISGEAPLNVKFDASSFKDSDGKITAYAWDFEGTGENRMFTDSTSATPEHIFEKAGTYAVQLKITDDAKSETIIEKTITVAEAATPKPVIKVQAEDNGKFIIGKQYLFDGSGSTAPAGTIQKYEWDFGDGSSKAQGKMVSHTFDKPGEYSATLKITDDKNKTGEISQKITVSSPASSPIAVITTTPAKKSSDKNLIGRVPFEVKFDASSSTDADNNIIEYQWDLDGNGSSDAFGAKTNYTYIKEGIYVVSLTVVDADNNEVKTTLGVDVKPPGVQTKLEANPASGSTPLTVSFDASGSSYPNGKIASYEWDFGDNTPKRLDNAKLTYKYAKIGTFTASVTAIGTDNSRDTAKVLITVTEVPLKACFEVTKHEGPAPFAVTFTATCSTGNVAKFKWDLNGDGVFNDAVGAQLTHTFDAPGTYNVSLEVEDNNNVTDTFKDTITVTAP